MKSHTLVRRMQADMDRGYQYISIWALTNTTSLRRVQTEEGLLTTLFQQHPVCRMYENLLPVLESLTHVTIKHVPRPEGH